MMIVMTQQTKQIDLSNHEDKKHASFPRPTHAASLVNILFYSFVLILTITIVFSKILLTKLILLIMSYKESSIKTAYRTQYNYPIKTYNKIK